MRRFAIPAALILSASFLLAGLWASGDEGPLSTAGEETPAGETQPTAHVDDLLRQSWKANQVTAAGKSSDAEFCRRVWMDLAGVAPPVWQLRQFLADSSSDKRDRLIDDLLDSPRFAYHMANRWNDFLLPPDELGNQQASESALHGWLRNQFLDNTPYDHLVGAFLTAGGNGESGPAVFTPPETWNRPRWLPRHRGCFWESNWSAPSVMTTPLRIGAKKIFGPSPPSSLSWSKVIQEEWVSNLSKIDAVSKSPSRTRTR